MNILALLSPFMTRQPPSREGTPLPAPPAHSSAPASAVLATSSRQDRTAEERAVRAYLAASGEAPSALAAGVKLLCIVAQQKGLVWPARSGKADAEPCCCAASQLQARRWHALRAFAQSTLLLHHPFVILCHSQVRHTSPQHRIHCNQLKLAHWLVGEVALMLAELCMDAAEDASAGRGASFQPQQENLHTGSAQVRSDTGCSQGSSPPQLSPPHLRLAGRARHDKSVTRELVHA